MFATEFVQLAQQRVPIGQHGALNSTGMVCQPSPLLANSSWPSGFQSGYDGWSDFERRRSMNLQARLDALKERHATLEQRITDEDQRPRPDSDTLTRLKIEKLH